MELEICRLWIIMRTRYIQDLYYIYKSAESGLIISKIISSKVKLRSKSCEKSYVFIIDQPLFQCRLQRIECRDNSGVFHSHLFSYLCTYIDCERALTILFLHRFLNNLLYHFPIHTLKASNQIKNKIAYSILRSSRSKFETSQQETESWAAKQQQKSRFGLLRFSRQRHCAKRDGLVRARTARAWTSQRRQGYIQSISKPGLETRFFRGRSTPL